MKKDPNGRPRYSLPHGTREEVWVTGSSTTFLDTYRVNYVDVDSTNNALSSFLDYGMRKWL